MKNKILVILGIIIFTIITYILFEECICYLMSPTTNPSILLEIGKEEKKYNGITIYTDGSIYKFEDTTSNKISKKRYKVMYSDLVKLKKYINELDGEFEVVSSNPKDNKVIYIYRRNEKIKIYESSNTFGQNNSNLSKKIIKISEKYN